MKLSLQHWMFLLALFILAAPILALAGEEAVEETADSTKMNEVVVTAERSPEDLSQSTRAVSIVTGEEIFQRIDRTVPEALRYQEGIMVQRTNLGGGAPFIRGMVGNQILYMVDGIRVNNSTFRSGPNQYLNTIDPFFIDRIEIVRGPGSVLYGSDALGGVINVITTRRKDFSKGFGSDGRLMGRFSTGEKEQTGHLGSTGNIRKTFGYAFSLSSRDFGDIDPGGNEDLQKPYGYYEQDFAGNFDFHLSDKVTVEFSVQDVSQYHVPNFDPTNIKNEFYPQLRTLFYSKVLIDDLWAYMDRIVLFGSYNLQTEGRSKIKSADPGFETNDLDEAVTIGSGLQLESPIGKWVRFIYGAEFYQDTIKSERETENLATGEIINQTPQLPDDSTFLSAAGYFEARVTPLDWLKLVPGVRYSYFEPDIEIDDPNLGTVKVDESISDFTWAFHTLFSFADVHGITLGASRGFRVPNIDDLSKLGSEDGRYDVPNSELDPESMIQYELGYRLSHPRIFFSAFGFYSMLDDIIVRKPTTYNGLTQINDEPIYHNENVGEAYIWGTEGNTRIVLLRDLLSIGGNVSYTFGENTTDDQPLRRIPPLLGSAFLKLEGKKAWCEVSMLAAAKQDRLSDGDKEDIRIGPDGTPGFDIWNFRIGMTPAEWIEGIMAVENVFDEEYKYHGSGPLEAGRNYKAQLSLKW